MSGFRTPEITQEMTGREAGQAKAQMAEGACNGSG